MSIALIIAGMNGSSFNRGLNAIIAWGRATLEVSFIRPPSTAFIVGPGTVVSVHLLDLPFVEPHYAVKYKTDGGELIEVWTHGKDILVLEGMHGILTYSTHPERILSFRVVGQEFGSNRTLSSAQ